MLLFLDFKTSLAIEPAYHIIKEFSSRGINAMGTSFPQSFDETCNFYLTLYCLLRMVHLEVGFLLVSDSILLRNPRVGKGTPAFARVGSVD